MAENAADMEMLVRAFEGDQAVMQPRTPTKPDAMAAAVAASTERVFTTILASVPNLVGKLIAMACDSPEHWGVVMTWTVPLQFKVLQEIAVLTFVDQEGFRTFLGNVMALAGSVKGGQRLPAQKTGSGSRTLSAG